MYLYSVVTVGFGLYDGVAADTLLPVVLQPATAQMAETESAAIAFLTRVLPGGVLVS